MRNKLAVTYLCGKYYLAEKFSKFMKCKRGEFMDVAIKILIAIVIGALILGGIYALWQLVILPRVTSEVNNMFNYS